jgi:glycosyltransferase involved in cell wall biosynthesis
MDLAGINFVPDIGRGDGYDLCFWVSDGSIPILRSRKNFLHFQVPFHGVGGGSLLNKMKFFRINKIICNSNFTKATIDREFGVDSLVIYPPVDVGQIKPMRKEDMILSVGRFSQLKQTKGQDVLIKSFIKLVSGGLSGWKLVVAGGVEVGVSDYIDKLTKLSEGYSIEIVKSPDFKTIKELYGKTKIFWSGAGYGEDESKNPEKVEHFGITVVEAMAAGAVPVIFSAGGHKETVESGVNGYLWKSPADLISKTRSIISDSGLRRKLAESAKQRSEKYSYSEFRKKVLALI